MTAVEWSEVVRNWAIVAACVAGFAVAIWRARVADLAAGAQIRQAELARREHVVALFDKAVDRLSSETMLERMAALYQLEALSDGFSDLAGPTVNLINAFLQDDEEAGNGLPADRSYALHLALRDQSEL